LIDISTTFCAPSPHVVARNEAISKLHKVNVLVGYSSYGIANAMLSLFSVVCFQGSQDGSAVLFPQKKVTKENSRLRLLL